MNKEVYIIGAGGHSKVIANVIYKSGDIAKGFLDDNIPTGTTIIKEKATKVIGTITDIDNLKLKYPKAEYIIGVGNNFTRKRICEQLGDKIKYYTAIDPSSQIALDVEIGEGTVILANACINTNAKIGKHCIINTGAIVEHDNILEDYVHISPNATLSGTVKIGEFTHVGSGVTIKNNINVCNNCIIGIGTAVVKNIDGPGVYAGVPSKRIK